MSKELYKGLGFFFNLLHKPSYLKHVAHANTDPEHNAEECQYESDLET